MSERKAKFSVGDLVHHRLFGYRGVIVDVDARFEGGEAWYEQVARSRPPKDRPWYHVLPHSTFHTTYVAERNLEPDDRLEPIEHPLLSRFFDDFRDGRYVATRRVN
jgi:heat shock protein HspQ